MTTITNDEIETDITNSIDAALNYDADRQTFGLQMIALLESHEGTEFLEKVRAALTERGFAIVPYDNQRLAELSAIQGRARMLKELKGEVRKFAGLDKITETP